jgi:phospholipid/cholesterol/gamma-HCH transport system substrate-binding protein
MKPLSERNPFFVGVAGVALTAGIALTALNYHRLPLVNGTEDYAAMFAESGGLSSGAAVQVSGFRVGEVSSVKLDGDHVLVKFDVDKDVRLGELTEAKIRTKSLLGAKVLEITPRGDGRLSAPIPMERTRSPYQLPDALGDLSATIKRLDTDSVSDALATLSDTFKDTPPALKEAVEGVGRFSKTLGDRDAQLRELLENANEATSVLSARSDEIVKIVRSTNALLSELQTQSSALEQISGNLSAFARQLQGFIDDNQEQLRPSLEKLNGVLATVDNRRDQLVTAIKYLNKYAMSLGDAVGSGPFFKGMIPNLIPGQLSQAFIDAAFSDLGLDPNTLSPAEVADPQVGQPATPALPVPYPRTGQGGEPRMTLPDAITGNPGDQQCGPPGIPLPGPGCYPYREPIPPGPPGGPPPGPPAPSSNTEAARDSKSPEPIYVEAPGEPQQSNGGRR